MSYKKSRFIISHYGVFKTFWDWFILIATFYVAVVVPYNASFVDEGHPRISVTSDVVVEALYIVGKKGEVGSVSKPISLNYIRSWFVVDFLAALPFDLFYASDVYSGAESTHGNVHLVKLTRLLRLARLFQKMDRYSQYSTLILTLLMLSFTLVAHWLTCIWFIIAEKEIEHHRNDSWDLAIIQRMYSRRSMYQSKWRDLKDFLTINQVPKELKQRMQDYFQTMWSLNHGIDIHEVGEFTPFCMMCAHAHPVSSENPFEQYTIG